MSDVRDCTHPDSLTIEYDASLSYSCSDVGLNEVVFTITDKCGNISTCISTVTIQSYRVIEELLLCPEDSIFIGNNWIHEPSVHIDTFTNNFGCDSLHITNINYVVNPPIPSVTVDCEELNVVLDINPQSIWKPTWDNGETTYQTIYEPTSLHANLTLNTGPNCEVQSTISIPAVPDLNDMPLLQDIVIQENTPLSVPINLNIEEWQMNWSPADLVNYDSAMLVNIVTAESAKIAMSLSHISGCTYESSFLLRVTLAPEHLYIPNVFSPNGDNRNDEWTVFHSQNLLLTECSIFNRWGELVYHSPTDQPKWDGKSQGEDCLPGVYVYVLHYSNDRGVAKIKSGDLTLVR